MDSDLLSMVPAHPPRSRTTRVDRAALTPWGLSDRTCVGLSLLALALGFVILGAEGLDLSPAEARLGLAAGGSAGPLGQVFGYWAPDLWPGEVLPSMALASLAPGGRPTSAAVRWPSALAAILGGWILVRGLHRTLGYCAGIWAGICWFGSLAVIDRSAGSGLDMILGASAGSGLDMILGVATLAAIDRLLARGADWVAGLWASLAFLAGGWPPLLLIGLVILVIGRPGSFFSARLVLPPLATAVGWSVAAIRAASAETWASALAMPLTRGIDWALPCGILLLGLPWTPFALVALSRSAREAWPAAGRAWVMGWLQAALACAIAGSAVPGLGPAARIVAMAGLLIAAAAGLDSAWKKTLAVAPHRTYFAAFLAVLALWLIAMILGSFVWIMTMPYYRTLGIIMGVMVLVVVPLGWSALGSDNTRRGLVTLAIMAVGLKLAHWGYYAPEWNYRHSQGPWGRAIGQWIPRKWPVYTLHDWPPDLAFFIGRPVRQLSSARLLNYLPGPECRFVLLLASEFENWPDQAPPLTPVARLQDQYGEERILARTPGLLPIPGQNALRPSDNRGRNHTPTATSEE
jgi:hypothetical protein